MGRLNIERQKKLEPSRIQFAKEEIEKLGYKIMYENERYLLFIFKDHLVRVFPYSGWHTGATINDGRGLNNLLNQIK